MEKYLIGIVIILVVLLIIIGFSFIALFSCLEDNGYFNSKNKNSKKDIYINYLTSHVDLEVNELKHDINYLKEQVNNLTFKKKK